MIDRKLLLKYDGNYARYTSYPTAPHFSSLIDGEIYRNWLKTLPINQTLSLYFHIPFCQQLCWYCGCYTKITKRYAPVENYLQVLIDEVRLIADLIKDGKHKVSHIHFGGGSPNILLPESFTELMSEIKANFVITADAEIAIEVDPRSINEEKVKTYAQCKINRVSIGVQDFADEVQQAINRVQSFEVVYDAIKLFRKYNIDAINIDLIYGLPKQTVQSIMKTIDYAMLLKPNRIAFFAYAHVQWMKKHMRLIKEEDLPNAALRAEMYQVTLQKLQEEGFKAIGLDHFVRPNDSMMNAFETKKLKRNFQGYSSDSADYVIGFGVSSISYLPQGYVQNCLDFEEYKNSILANKLAVKKGIVIGEDDKMRKKIIDEIMCYLRIDLKHFIKEYALSDSYFAKELANLAQLQKDGLVEIKDDVITINSQARQICRVVSSVFDKYFSASAARHSRI